MVVKMRRSTLASSIRLNHANQIILSHRELTKACEMHIKQEDEGKFRCKQCNKLFKAMAFVEKHVANKHAELIKHLDEVRLPLPCTLLNKPISSSFTVILLQ